MKAFDWLLRQDARLREALATVPGVGLQIVPGLAVPQFFRTDPEADWLPCSEAAIVAKAAEVWAAASLHPRDRVGGAEWELHANSRGAWVRIMGCDHLAQPSARAATCHEAACRLLAAALGVEWAEEPA